MNKKIVAAAVCVVLLCVCLLFCNKPEKEADTIKIGYLGSLTGDFAIYGTTEANAVQLVIDEVNAQGGLFGKKLVLVVGDTKSKCEDAVNAVRRMILADKVCAFIGTDTSGTSLAVAPIADREKVPHISTLGTNPYVTVHEHGAVRPYAFRICFTDPYQGKIAAEFAYGDLKARKAALLYNVGSDYAHGFREYFVKSFTDKGGKIVADEGYRDTDVDFRAQLTKIKYSGADVLLLPGMGKDMALIIKQARELQLKVNFIGGDGYAEFMSEIAGDALKGSYWINHTYQEAPEMAPVFAKYRKVYHDEGKEFTDITMAYDAAKWLVDAIKRAGSTDGEAVAKALEETTKLKLTHCTISVDPATHNLINKPAVILKVGSDLKGRYYKTVSPE